MFSLSALARANSSFASHSAIISTNPSLRAASTCAGPINPVPMIPALIFFIRILAFYATSPDRGHLRPSFRLLRSHDRFQNRDAFGAIKKIRMDFQIGRNGIHKIENRMDEGVLVSDHMSRWPPCAEVRMR